MVGFSFLASRTGFYQSMRANPPRRRRAIYVGGGKKKKPCLELALGAAQLEELSDELSSQATGLGIASVLSRLDQGLQIPGYFRHDRDAPRPAS